MSTPNPIQQAEAAFAVAIVINIGTKGVAAKKPLLAAALLVYVNALEQIAGGDIVDGSTALMAAVQSPGLDAGVALALKSLLSVSTVELTALEAVAEGTLVGQADMAIAVNLLTAAGIALQSYIPAPPAA